MISKLEIFALFSFFILVLSGTVVSGMYKENTDEQVFSKSEKVSDDFYFVHITDTHVMNKIFDRSEVYKNRLKSVISYFTSLENKPAFIVITGDLVAIGGGIVGSLNYRAFLSCFYKKDDQLYADSDYKIPVYTTPGNHDYFLHANLFNYHRFVDSKHIAGTNLMELLEKRGLNDRYIIKHENLSLFFLDTGHLYYLKPWELTHIKGSGLSYWFDIEWLDSSLNNCSSKHRIVLMHFPAINLGDYDIIANNNDIFLTLCEGYNIDLVLAGHTHAARVFDKNRTFYPNNVLPLNCSKYPPLYVQTDACKEGCYYRNITIVGNDVWLGECKQII